MTKHLLGLLILYAFSSCNLLETPTKTEEDLGNDITTNCSDGVKNSEETDVDCGGSCGPCSVGQTCIKNADCDGGECTNGECKAPSCDDELQNANESDVDCGGTCTPCSPGSACVEHSDCDSILCKNTQCTTAICGDGIVNGMDECDAGGVVTATCKIDCTIPLCGNGIIDDDEICDDGNLITETCPYGEPSCMVCSSLCVTLPGELNVCGDGKVDNENEVCDDGVNDGSIGSCLGDCSAEIVCGDDMVQGLETCDDGNMIDDDGCDASCQIEIPADCKPANGLTWCRDLTADDQTCNTICANSGGVPEDDVATLAAQASIAECTTIRDLFGVTTIVNLGSYTRACTQYSSANFTCSTFENCPANHRTQEEGDGFISVCACDLTN